MSKTSQSEKPKAALVVLSDKALAPQKQQLKKFQARTIDALEIIGRTEQLNTQRRMLVGVALLIIKEHAKHGEFLPWLKNNVSGVGYTQCTYLMRAARIFVEQSKLESGDLLALTSGVGTLTLAKNATGTKLAQASREFVGDLSWGELLDKHGIRETKKLGGARTAANASSAIDPEELAAHTREELGAFIAQGRQLLIEENVCQRLTPDDVRAFDASAEALLNDWRKANAAVLKK